MVIDFFRSFSTRDYALLTWGLFFFIILILYKIENSKTVWIHIPRIAKTILKKYILLALSLVLLNNFVIYKFLDYLGFWSTALYDEFTLSILIAFSLLFGFLKGENKNITFKLLFGWITMSGLFEAITDYQTYSFPAELLITFTFTIFYLYKMVREFENKNTKVVDKILVWLGLALLLLAVFITSINFNTFSSKIEVAELFFSFVYPLLILPSLYFLLLYEHYSMLFKLASWSLNDKKRIRKFQIASLAIGKISIEKVRRMRRNFGWSDFNKFSEWQVAALLNNPGKLEREIDVLLNE